MVYGKYDSQAVCGAIGHITKDWLGKPMHACLKAKYTLYGTCTPKQGRHVPEGIINELRAVIVLSLDK